MRAIFGNIGTLVLPGTISIVKAHEAFAPDGTLKDPKQHERVAGLGAELAEFLRNLQPPSAASYAPVAGRALVHAIRACVLRRVKGK